MGSPQRHPESHIQAANANSHDTFGTRLVRLGPLSLSSLIAGGLVLILTALNALLGPKLKPRSLEPVAWVDAEVSAQQAKANRFHVGQSWSIQTWLAVVGIGIGLITHGLHEANMHLFDWWCSRQARQSAGLDYARYLNTQSRAPVSYGIRGFPLFASLRYFVLVVSVTISIGYKFGVTETTVAWQETIDPSIPFMTLDNQTGPYFTFSTSFSDQVTMAHWFGTGSGAFTYDYQPVADDSYDEDILLPEYQHSSDPDPFKPPERIILAGQLKTPFDYLINQGQVLGDVTCRQVVAVANLAQDEGNFTMSRDEGGWYRAQTLDDAWSGHARQKAVVDYRILEPGKIQIQWAPLGPWLTDENSAERTQRVSQRWTYSIKYATSEVERRFTDDTGQGRFRTGTGSSNATILKEGSAFPSTDQVDDEFLEQRRIWINAQIAAQHTRISQGVIDIIRPIMYEWAVVDAHVAARGRQAPMESGYFYPEGGWGILSDHGDIEHEFIRLLPNDEFPFGQENHSDTERVREYPTLSYPYLIGERSRGILGAYPAAAGAYLTIGIISIVIAILRVCVGPAELTSWTGQHIFFSQTGAISELQNQEALNSGYDVAPPQLGRLRIGYKAPDSSKDTFLHHDLLQGETGSIQREAQNKSLMARALTLK